jgi:hypothetical protein
MADVSQVDTLIDTDVRHLASDLKSFAIHFFISPPLLETLRLNNPLAIGQLHKGETLPHIYNLSTAMDPPRHNGNDMGRTKRLGGPRAQHHPWPPPRRPGVYMTIGDLLRSSNLTEPEIKRVEDALKQRERTIDERNDELEQSRYKIRVLTENVDKTQNAFQRATAKLEDSNVAMDKLQSAHHDLQERKDLQDCLLNMGRRIIEEKSEEIQELRTQLAERDSTISALNDRIVRVGMASADEAVVLANEASAHRSLKIFEGYQKDIAARDEVIKQYKESFKMLNAQLRGAEEAAKGVVGQAAEAKEIADEQQVLIEKLLKEGSS